MAAACILSSMARYEPEKAKAEIMAALERAGGVRKVAAFDLRARGLIPRSTIDKEVPNFLSRVIRRMKILEEVQARWPESKK